tara:strand:- start:1516 stop:1782 length:267 start_codon:yes stop_codon:yes gene_type:complete
MQRIVNVIALTSGVISFAVVATGGYLFLNKDAIVDNVKGQVMEAVTGSLGGIGGGALGGAAGLAPDAPEAPGAPAQGSTMGLPVPGGF